MEMVGISTSSPRHFTCALFLVICLLVCSVPKGDCQFGPPPTLHIDRNWRIQEDVEVGTLVRRAQAISITDTGDLNFTIQPSDHNDDLSTYFRIDSNTGGIFLAKSLKNKRGTRGYLYVTVRSVPVDDSPSIPTRVEVMIQIDPPLSSGSNSGPGNFTSRPPYPPFGLYPPVVPPFLPGDVPKIPPSVIIPSAQPVDVTVDNNVEISTAANEGSTVTNQPTTVPPKPITEPAGGNNSKSGNGTTTTTTSAPLDLSSVGKETEPGLSKPIPEREHNSVDGEEVIGNASPSEANKENKPVDNSNTVTLVTVIPIVVVFGVVPIVLATFWLLKKRTKVQKRPTKEIRKESAATTASSVTMSGEGETPSALTHWNGKRAQSNRYESWDPDAVSPQVQNRWEFPRHHLQIGGILGEGCFGQVWRCEALNIDRKEGTTTVAVKTLKESAGERERADLLSELAVMKMLDPHPNVVRLLGSCTEKDPIFLIMEYVALGKLQTYLRSSRAQHYYGNLHGDSSSLSSKDLTSFAHQVARGMEYLASKGIIHRDLAARNILIDKERVCKVADFGFARDVVVNHVYERKSDGRLPIRWMAPEALYDNIFTTKTDVWSFGVLMWEIVTLGSTPYPGMAASEVMRKVRDGYRLEKPEHCRRELYNIMFYCWAHNPDDRPSFAELVNFLRHLLFSETDYIELDRFPDHDYYNMTSLSGEKL